MVQVVSNIALDFDAISFVFFDASANITPSSDSPGTGFTVSSNSLPAPVEVSGLGFTYDPTSGFPQTGTIKTVEVFLDADAIPEIRLSRVNLTIAEAIALSDDDPLVAANEVFKGRDSITGSQFADVLCGFKGRDTLIGRGGDDVFVLNAPAGAANADHIKQFVVGQDKIGIDGSVFPPNGAPSIQAAFKDITNGLRVVDANDRFLYNHDSGNLYYDADGRGGAGKELIAILDNDPLLTFRDFAF